MSFAGFHIVRHPPHGSKELPDGSVILMAKELLTIGITERLRQEVALNSLGILSEE